MKKKQRLKRFEGLETIKNQAEALIFEKKYKEALDYYKILFKQDPKDDYKRAIGDCYIGRIGEIKEKGMHREATVLWENHRPYCEDSCPHVYLYINLLLAVGLENSAVLIFIENKENLKNEEKDNLEEIFAALSLSGNSELIKVIQSYSLIGKHLPFIEQAIELYNRRDFTQMEIVLSQIPFRSPYRNARQVLKGLLLMQSDKVKALALLKEIKATSPFYKLASIARLAFSSYFDIAKSLKTLSKSEFEFLSVLKGWEEGREKHLDKLRKLETRHISKLFDLNMSGVSYYTLPFGRTLAFSMLPFYKVGIKSFEKTFEPLSEEERVHLTALEGTLQKSGESYQKVEDFFEKWTAYEDFLGRSFPQKASIRLKRALIVRYLEESDSPNHSKDCLCPKRMKNLEKSLELDPFDKPTFLKVIEYYRKKGPPKTCLYWINKAVKTFSEDREILILAIDIAQRIESLDFALELTERLLQLDPINKKAHQYLGEIYLKKAQIFMMENEWDKAENILNKIVSKDFFKVVVTLNQGILAYLQGRLSEAWALIQCHEKDFKSRLQLYIEAIKLKVPIAVLTEKMNLCAFGQLEMKGKKSFLEILKIIDDNALYIEKKVPQELKTCLEKADYSFTKEELLSVSECFTKIKEFDLVKMFIKKSPQPLKKEPIFIYYYINAKIKGEFDLLKDKDFFLLEDAFARAQEMHDIQASILIDNLLFGTDDSEDSSGSHLFENEDQKNEDELKTFDSLNILNNGEDMKKKKAVSLSKAKKEKRENLNLNQGDLF